MLKQEKYGLIVLMSIIIGLTIYSEIQMRDIDKNPAFVIGHMKKAEFDGPDSGWMFDFEYSYNIQQYYTRFGGPINESAVKDSLIYLKISTEKPHLSRPVLGQWVPPCMVKEGQPILGWKEIPFCK